MKLLVIDNYDSFTYNLVHILRQLGVQNMDVIRNDKITVEEVEKYDKILLSPGPGIPDEAGIMKETVERLAAEKSILGICLGHQGIGEVFGAKLYNMSEVLHGVASDIELGATSDYLFAGLPKTFKACHYHSWAILPESVPDCLEVIARDGKGNIMAVRHKKYDVRGLQFHPESILTEHGIQLLQNWINN